MRNWKLVAPRVHRFGLRFGTVKGRVLGPLKNFCQASISLIRQTF